MKAKNTALIISAERDFVNQYAPKLRRENFEIIKAKGYDDWDNKRHLYRFDICIVDNRGNDFPHDKFYHYINRYSPHSVVINIGNGAILSPPGTNFLYSGTDDVIHFDSFVENMGEFFKRAKARTELAAMLIHDIRSPLHSMLAYIELLLNQTFGQLNDGQRNFLEKAMVLGDQTLDMLEDINEIYRSEQYLFSIEKEPLDLETTIDQALLNVWIQADKKNIKIKKEIGEDLAQVSADGFQIQRVIVNLISNAVKYCPENAQIVVRAERATERLARISVIDNGSGIPEADLETVFKKAFRVKETEHLHKGYGLGLYICKLIVKAHGGTIKAQNNPEGGVSFIFTLPFLT